MSQQSKPGNELQITFTGGLGAQIFSAAIYFYLKSADCKVYADLNYFNKPARNATTGNKGEVSHWNYELNEYGLPLSGFAVKQFKKKFFKSDNPHVISDGVEKLKLALEAMYQHEIKSMFPINGSRISACNDICPNSEYLCLHIRRGDYLNVTTHLALVKYTHFISLAKSLATSVSAVIVVSDSDIPNEISRQLQEIFDDCYYFIGGEPHVTHALMRRAKYLACSNSQFGLSAALLNDGAQQIFLPTKWFGEAVSQDLQVPIDLLCNFQILDRH